MALYQEIRNEKNELTGYKSDNGNISIPVSTGNSDYQKVLKWISEGNTPDPDGSLLTKVKQAKVEEYKVEGVRLIGLQVPEWNTFDRVAFIASVWNMLGTPNTEQTLAKDIYVYVKNTAIPNVNVQTDVASVQAIDVVNDTNWP